jgi:hypothetical protein
VRIDSVLFDIDAAHKAGVRCIAVRSGGSPDTELSAADAIFDAPLDIVGALADRNIDELVRTANPVGLGAGQP